jgi:hypothetical protein
MILKFCSILKLVIKQCLRVWTKIAIHGRHTEFPTVSMFLWLSKMINMVRAVVGHRQYFP